MAAKRNHQTLRIPPGTVPPAFNRGAATSIFARRRARWETALRAAKITGKTVKGGVHVVRFGHRHRVRLAPVYLAAGSFATGYALWQGHHGAQGTAVVAAGAAVMLTAQAARAHRRKQTWTRLRAGTTFITYLCSMLWLLAASEVGIDRPLTAVGLAGWLLFAVPYWWHRRARPVEAVSVTGATELGTWQNRVSAQDGALPGSWLSCVTVHEDSNGFKALINLVQGKHTIESAQAAIPRIASAFGVTIASVAVTPTASAEAHQAWLEVYKQNPLQKGHDWPGPQLLDLERGLSPIGMRPDGSLALYQWFAPGSGPVMDLISGATGSGKSQLLSMLLAYERHNGFVSLVIDPQEGQSLIEWSDDPDAVDVFARSAEEGLQLLRAAQVAMYDRNRQLARKRWVDEKGRQRRGVGGFVHTPEMPLIVITIDEAHKILRAYPEAVAICEDIAKMGRKCGLKLRLATQVPLLDQLGNSNTLREQLASGNVIVLRTGGRISSQVAFQGALSVDPFLLPRRWPDGSSTAGLGFMLAAEASETMLRTYRVEDAFGWATSGSPGRLEPRLDSLFAPLRAEFRARFEDDDDELPIRHVVSLASAAVAQTTRSFKQRIAEFFEHRSTVATTGAVAKELDINLSTVSTTLDRLAKDGVVEKVAHGMWKAASVAEENRELEAIDA